MSGVGQARTVQVAPTSARWRRLQPYVLRSWEAEFPGLGKAGAGGRGRVYRRADVELVLRIKQLVFGEGLTLAGARRRLDEEQQGEPSSAAAVAVDDVLERCGAHASCARCAAGSKRSCRCSSRDAAGARADVEWQLVRAGRAAVTNKKPSSRQRESRDVECSTCRDVAQPGSALDWGSRGRWFESSHPDQFLLTQDSASAMHKPPTYLKL